MKIFKDIISIQKTQIDILIIDILSSEFNEWSILRLPRKCEFRSAQNFLETGQKKTTTKKHLRPFQVSFPAHCL